MENWEKQDSLTLLVENIISDILTECGTEPDGEKLWVKNSDELEKVIKPILSSKLINYRESAKQEERERIENVENYLYDIEIPPGDARIDVNFDVKYYAMKMEDKLKAEFVANRLKYWLKLQVLYLEKGLKKQIDSLHQKNNEQGGK